MNGRHILNRSFEGFKVLVFLSLAYYLYFLAERYHEISDPLRIIMATAVLAYAIFKILRLVAEWRNDHAARVHKGQRRE